MLLINKPLERLYLHIISSEPKQSDKSDKYFCILRQALYILHFLLTGKNSERSNGPVFDSRWALTTTPRGPLTSSREYFGVYSSVVERSIAASSRFFCLFFALHCSFLCRQKQKRIQHRHYRATTPHRPISLKQHTLIRGQRYPLHFFARK